MQTQRQHWPYQAPLQPEWGPPILSPLELATAPSGAVLDTAALRNYCRIDNTEEDALLDELIAAAADYCEKKIPGHRQILQAVYDVRLARWWEGPLALPRPPLASAAGIGSVKYYATDGTLTTLSSSNYVVLAPMAAPGTIERAPGISWPALQSERTWPIVIRFTAGYPAGRVPKTIEQAIRLLVARWYDERPLRSVSKETDEAICSLLHAEDWGSYE